MRDDMAKVIVERPRVRAHGARKGRMPLDPEALPLRMGMRKAAKISGDVKTLNENLAPLRRYLRAQVGRPWNTVYAGICEHLKPTSTVQQHVRDHIADFVAHPVVIHDGRLCGQGRWGGMRPLEDGFWLLYVDPRTGLLRRAAWETVQQRARRRLADRERARDDRVRVIDDTRQLHLLADGNWWEISLAPVPTHTIRKMLGRGTVRDESVELPVVDVVLDARLSPLARKELYGREGVYAVAKRPLAKRELRRLALRR